MPPPQDTEHAVQGLFSHLEKELTYIKNKAIFYSAKLC